MGKGTREILSSINIDSSETATNTANTVKELDDVPPKSVGDVIEKDLNP